MTSPARPIAFVLAATSHGSLIVNRFDRRELPDGQAYGVGQQLFDRSAFDPEEVELAKRLLDCRRMEAGDGLVALDGGANIGVHTVEWARHMHGWGSVLAIEAQETVFYALAGNLALNNCFNARAFLAALGAEPGTLPVPQPDYCREGSFGSLELRRRQGTEFIGQAVSYDPADCRPVQVITVDSLGLERLDFFKLDVEGMEADVLRGARETLARCKPLLLVEVIKSDQRELRELLGAMGYRGAYPLGLNWLAVHRDDPAARRIDASDGRLVLRTEA
ncbi:FkbM family methyltransferase [Ramlibacter humi]|uniref:FkbM family methyltransferase n=1 Tax=Ramlibacter humi TaxID=2530451 RepID=A0A4Z0BIF1_9BURK|nr:FkbM family methyltransferase [Ramlibacter humi]TFY99106.1 FkbM family methyltransferase [Ramlibacter humi]